jgi:transcription initiation factor TFIID subunit 5
MFMKRFYNYFSMTHRVTLDRLSALSLPIHVAQSELARRFREEKYVCRLSKSGKDLLLGWLTDGTGGEDMGSGAGIIGGTRAKEGRDQVLRVINNCLQFHGMLSLHFLESASNPIQFSDFISFINHLSKRMGGVYRPTIQLGTQN